MTCEEATKMLVGDPSKEDWILLDAHIDACPACDARLQEACDAPLSPGEIAILNWAKETRRMCPSLEALRSDPTPAVATHLLVGCNKCTDERERLLRGETVAPRISMYDPSSPKPSD